MSLAATLITRVINVAKIMKPCFLFILLPLLQACSTPTIHLFSSELTVEERQTLRRELANAKLVIEENFEQGIPEKYGDASIGLNPGFKDRALLDKLKSILYGLGYKRVAFDDSRINQEFRLQRRQVETYLGMRPADVFTPNRAIEEMALLNCPYLIIYMNSSSSADTTK